jgi:hypothetical protein
MCVCVCVCVCVRVCPRAGAETAESGDGMETLDRTRLGRREPPLHHLSPQAKRPDGLGFRDRCAVPDALISEQLAEG